MQTTLYLDTARMGPMSPVAQRAVAAYISLLGQEGCSFGFEQFLRDGELSSAAQSLLGEDLGNWQGLHAFHNRLRSLVGLPEQTPVFLANRTSQLMRVASRFLGLQCRKILTTDLEWPPFVTILENHLQCLGGQLVRVPLANDLFGRAIPATEILERILSTYDRRECDGLFLSAVSYHGVRMPLEELSRRMATLPKSPRVVVDGAQDLGHTPTVLSSRWCDFYLAGTHKWLQSALPMGLAFCPRPRSQSIFEQLLTDMYDRGELDDPLLGFSRELELDATQAFGETVSLACLFSANAAVTQLLEAHERTTRFDFLRRQACLLEETSRGTGWLVSPVAEELRSGILLLQAGSANPLQEAPIESIREHFQSRGIALTSYDKGVIRLSSPSTPLTAEQQGNLRSALLN